jgi:hypothetical protein
MVPVTQQFRVSCTAQPPLGRPDNGSEFTAHAVRGWLGRIVVKTLYIEPGSPWENGYNERFNGTLRREVLNAEWFTSIKQAQVVIETWLKQYNHIRSHQALNMRPPVPETLSGVVHKMGALQVDFYPSVDTGEYEIIIK